MPVRINHRQLEAFQAVMQVGSITRAADMLGVTQPAVSRLIKALEQAIGYNLFEREKGRLQATPDAAALYESVEKSFVGIDKVTQAAADIKKFKRGALQIASLPAMALGFLPKVISKFAGERDGINVSMQIRSSQKVVEMIASQQFDLGLAATQVHHPAIRIESLLRTQMVCIIPKGHVLTDKDIISPKDLQNERFISLGEEWGTRHMIDSAFRIAGVSSRRATIDTQLSEAACAFVREGFGVSIVEPISAAESLGRGLVAKPFEPAIEYEYSLLYPQNRPTGRLAKEFVESLKQELMLNPLIEKNMVLS